MDELQNLLIERIEELNRMIKQAEAFLAKAPDGTLRIAQKNDTAQYYHRTDGRDTEGRYIRKSQKDLIRTLAQKEYEKKVLAQACREKRDLEQMLGRYHPEKIMEIYEKLSQSRQALVTPYVLPDDAYIVRWKRVEYPIKCQKIEEDAIYTENGEAVRSKSEKILADKFKMMDIPYHYEKPLMLKGYGTVYPGFTVLNKRTRKEYCWEHFGMMDNPEYAKKAVKKIETMTRNGFYQGKNLILTYETSAHLLNMKVVELLIREYLI